MPARCAGLPVRAAAVASALALVATEWGIVPVVSQTLRTVRPDDVYEIRTVREPRVSPDGTWVAYTVSRADRTTDTIDSDIYTTPLDAQMSESVQMTASPGLDTSPRWSPDNRYLAFLSDREGDHRQVWLLDRRGGEATRLTTYRADVSEMSWSPDGSKLALVVKDEQAVANESAAFSGTSSPRPIVVSRLQFKREGLGYLDDRRTHLHVFDLATRSSTQVTTGAFDDRQPAWSPDGRIIAFTSNRTPDADANFNTDIFTVPAGGGTQTPLTRSARAESHPVFSPDGSRVAYVVGGMPEDLWYDTTDIGIVSVNGGVERVLTEDLDRFVSPPLFTADGGALLFIVERGGNAHLASVPAGGGPIRTLVDGERNVSDFHAARRGPLAVLVSEPDAPAEVFAWEEGRLRTLTTTNARWRAGIALGRVERIRVTAPHGPPLDAFVTHPAVDAGGRRRAAVVRLHGGPVQQHSTAFQLEWQVLAGAGFAVVAPNPRGSSGYGRDFSHAIWAAWGEADRADVLAVVDDVVGRGIADPKRLGVGGWSYGGILTNYLITRSQRFKAAITGASEVNYLANYGVDHYQRQWEAELGLPWRSPQTWMALSPFFDVERVTTPTLIMTGADDMNVPPSNSEQLYQALKRLGRVDTELVIYPDQGHAIVRPSFQVDRFERYVAWYGTYLR